MHSLAINTYLSVDELSEDTVFCLAASASDGNLNTNSYHFDSPSAEDLKLKSLGFTAKFGEVLVTVWKNRLMAIVGFGERPPTAEDYRKIGGCLARALKSNQSLAIGFSVKENVNQIALIEGCALTAPTVYSLKSKAVENALTRIYIPSSFEVTDLDLENISIQADAVNVTRQLVNMPSNLLYPEVLAEKLAELIDVKSVQIQTWDVRRLHRERSAGLIAVGSGSFREPRMVKLSYEPKISNSHLALVGKGITFDTGGISLKPRESMAGMKYDMAGAATVAMALLAIAKMNLPVKVTAWLCLAENMPSGSAARPNDVITYRNGKTVEIMNTDAEGRLVLADGLILASEESPNLIVDVATLTGAATVALGKRFGAVMGNTAGTDLIMQAFEDSGESAWLMPMPEELKELLESPVADLANAKLGNSAGGMIIGAHFLNEFVGSDSRGQQIPWAHLDIAGPANNDGSAFGYTPKGASGYSVRTLVSLARLLAEGQSNAE